MSTLQDIIQLINQLAADNARVAQQAKGLLEENRTLKARVAELEGKEKGSE